MKKSKLILILYIVAALLGVMFIYEVISSFSYVSSYASGYGMSISDMMGEAISYVLTNSVVWLVYGILVFIGAKILDAVTPAKAAPVKEEAPALAAAPAEEAPAAEEEAPAAEEEAPAEPGPVPPLYTSNSFLRH